ncbi:hypothetical protein [Pedobacter caeni]|uniref:Uncharacterized protein n=1 Tax=Pedobacter caeni TaxID=288992 RepID=A0A1M4ZNJ0_9SPHI|nr:hypothetical protein [Pedobacter caeni]SHF19146.1 hypothetical protein SAMN04488522_102384 [Pedobacter caeni]
MGFSKAIIAIKGNHLDHLEKVSAILNYFDGVDDQEILEELSETAEYENDWTLLTDEEMVYVVEDDLIGELSQELAAAVYTFTVQTTSASYGFSYFEGDKNRVFLVQDGDIISDEGESLSIETGQEISEDIGEEDIVALASKLGISLEEE